jgi:hypothetical protein
MSYDGDYKKKNEVGFTTSAVLYAVCEFASIAAAWIEVGATNLHQHLFPLVP